MKKRPPEISEQIERLYGVTGSRSQAELASFMGISQAAVSDAKRRGSIPEEWLVHLSRLKGIEPEWILTGRGKKYKGRADGEYARKAPCLNGQNALPELKDRTAVSLAEELLKRVEELETMHEQIKRQ